jgi:hypothetical protein
MNGTRDALTSLDSIELTYSEYPPGITDWINRHGGMQDTMIFMPYQDLRVLYGDCRE